MASDFVDLVYEGGRLMWPGGSARAACGRGGVRADKREGDGASPEGIFPLVRPITAGPYRPSRDRPHADGATPRARLVRRSRRSAVQSSGLAALRCAAREAVARGRALRSDRGDGYNIDPPVPGLGSAIFLHVANPDFAPTEGCIAIERDVLAELLARLGPGSTIAIRP